MKSSWCCRIDATVDDGSIGRLLNDADVNPSCEAIVSRIDDIVFNIIDNNMILNSKCCGVNFKCGLRSTYKLLFVNVY